MGRGKEWVLGVLERQATRVEGGAVSWPELDGLLMAGVSSESDFQELLSRAQNC